MGTVSYQSVCVIHAQDSSIDRGTSCSALTKEGYNNNSTLYLLLYMFICMYVCVCVFALD